MEDLEDRIRRNLEEVQEKIVRAAQSAGRNPNEVKLVVVSKGQPVEVIRAAITAGARIFGENYPEQAQPKIATLRGQPGCEAQWHMIGHLQSRKARIVAEDFDCLHSLDRVDMAEKLERQLEPLGKTLPALLEINLGGEESKSGWQVGGEGSWAGLISEVEQVRVLPHLEIRGLMAMPPLSEDPQQARPYFTGLAKLRDYLSAKIPGIYLSELSMGTSADYEVAVQEGATLVRVGTAILGARPPKVN